MSLGLDPADYWDYTPAEGAIIVAGRVEVLKNEHNSNAKLAHTIARLMRLKDLNQVPLDRLLIKSVAPKRRQSPEEMIAVMRSIVAAMNAPNQRKR